MDNLNTSRKKQRTFFSICLVISGLILGAITTEMVLGITKTPCDYNPENYPLHYASILEPIGRPFFNIEKLDSTENVSFARMSIAHRDKFPSKKDPSEFRVVIIGESVAEEFGVFAELSKNTFSAISQGKDVRIINAGVSGYTSPKILSVAKELTKFNPDLVLLFMGNNLAYNYNLLTWRLLRKPPKSKN